MQPPFFSRSGSATQDFIFESNGNIYSANGSKLCISSVTSATLARTRSLSSTPPPLLSARWGRLCLPGSLPQCQGRIARTNRACTGRQQQSAAVGEATARWCGHGARPQQQGPQQHRRESAASKVFGIWTSKEVPLAAGASSFTTDSIGAHDSRCYLISLA